MNKIVLPKGFRAFVAATGLKDSGLDTSCVWSDCKCAVAGVFTQSLTAGPSVEMCKSNLESKSGQAIVTIAKNANVANGAQGRKDAEEVVGIVSKQLGISNESIYIGSTGVIGRLYPMDKLRVSLSKLSDSAQASIHECAEAMMTTDSVPKVSASKCGKGSIVGVCKGVGMMEPNMATLLVYFFTDVLPLGSLDHVFRDVIDRTFNSMSIDTDTSTSDTALIFANGANGEVDMAEFRDALFRVAQELMLMVCNDAEGATKLLKVTATGAASSIDARCVGKNIVNSPLVKCAVHGADPNWGRVIMAIGKSNGVKFDLDTLSIDMCGLRVYPGIKDDVTCKLREALKLAEVHIEVDLGCGASAWTVWGCDLSPEYVNFNADYTS